MSVQSVIMVRYVTVGHTSPEAAALRQVMGEWDSEWSLRHTLRVLRRAILDATMNTNSADQAKLGDMVQTLGGRACLAA